MAQVAQLPAPALELAFNEEAEMSVLGAMMDSPGAIGAVSEHLTAGDFYYASHQTIYRAAVALYTKGDPVDPIMLAAKLEEQGELEGIGGRAKIQAIATWVVATANAAHHARIVRDNAVLRRLIEAGSEIVRLGTERGAEADQLVAQAEQELFKVSQQNTGGELTILKDSLVETFARVSELYEQGASVTGLSSGFTDLDAITAGFQPGNLVILAARPSMGKSALGMCISANVAVRQEVPCAFFSLEMSRQEIAQRLMCLEGRIDSHKIRTGKLTQEDWPRLTQACSTLEKAPLYIDDTPGLTLLELRSRAQTLKRREPQLGLVVVDYLQLMAMGGSVESRLQEVSAISRGLKALAKDLDIPVLALSQLSRAVEQRTDKRPILSDLRESGCLTGDTRVYLPSTGTYRRIDELTGKRGFDVLAIDDASWRLEPRAVLRAFATGRKPVFRLSTRLGRTIRATANHKFLAFDGWRRLDDLAPGMRLAVPRALPGPCADTISRPRLALLGHLIGDGCTLPRHTLQYTSKDEDLATLVAQLALEAFGEEVRPRVVRERGWYQTYLVAAGRLARGRRNPIAEWLDGLGAFGLRAPDKRVPDEVFAQSAEGIAHFLRHLWATDGCVWAGSGRRYHVVRFDSSSERLVADVQSLLLRLGITARRRRVPMHGKGLDCHRLDVTGQADLRRFVARVGAVGERKSEQCRLIEAALERATATTNRDTIPREAWRSVVVPALAAAGVTTRGLQERLGTSYCGSTLYRSGLSRDRALLVAGIVESEELSSLATSDVYWDEVVSIEPAGEEEVYDLTVDGLHSFVADDVVVHNSIEQDADLVMFIYRDEYYNGEESEQQGLAEVHVAKHRNGPTDTLKLTFLKRYAKFAAYQAA